MLSSPYYAEKYAGIIDAGLQLAYTPLSGHENLDVVKKCNFKQGTMNEGQRLCRDNV